MTDRHTHTHIHTHTDKPSGEVKNIISFFKGIINIIFTSFVHGKSAPTTKFQAEYVQTHKLFKVNRTIATTA